MASMVDEESTRLLVSLGLTVLQAKVYLTLSQTEQATIKAIAKNAGIARQDVYRVIPTLEKLGLAEKMLTAPAAYRAMPLREGCYLLLHNKEREHIDLQKKTIALIKNLREDKGSTTLQAEEPQFIVTSSESLLFRRLADRDKTAQKSIDASGEWRNVKLMLFDRAEEYSRAIKRGVRIRLITEKHEENKTMQKLIQTLKATGMFSIRYVAAPIPVKIAMFDEAEVNLCIAPTQPSNVPSLWSNNPRFVKIISTYFEILWNSALDTPKNLRQKTGAKRQTRKRLTPVDAN